MNQTMFFNPLVLNEGLRKMISRTEFPEDRDLGFYSGARLDADGENTGTRFDFGYSDEILHTYAEFYVGRSRLNDDYKYGSANTFGVGSGLYYGAFGFGAKMLRASWENVMIMTNEGFKTEAESRLFYGFFDFSPKFEYVRPLVRLNYVRSEIEGRSEEDFYISYGGRVSFTENMMGIRYRYGLYVLKGDELDFGLSIDCHLREDEMAFGIRLSPTNLSVEMKVSF
jgi:hypothetical protein